MTQRHAYVLTPSEFRIKDTNLMVRALVVFVDDPQNPKRYCYLEDIGKGEAFLNEIKGSGELHKIEEDNIFDELIEILKERNIFITNPKVVSSES